MTTSTFALIGKVHDLRDQKRKRHNAESFKLLTVNDLCRVRDALRLIESIGLQPETPSSYIQLLINGRQ
jgi:hypothetical protein